MVSPKYLRLLTLISPRSPSPPRTIFQTAANCVSTEERMASTQETMNAGSAWQVELLRRQYLQLIDPNELAIPCNEALRSPDLQGRIYNSMFNETSLRFSPPDRYKFRVLKELVAAIEQAIVDPEEDVCFVVLLSLPLTMKYRRSLYMISPVISRD